jgi:hypothetical protein
MIKKLLKLLKVLSILWCVEMAPFDPVSVCRLCTSEKDLCVNIFGQDGVKHNLSKKN